MFRLLVCSALFVAVSAAAERPPNVILILADDLGYGETGCYGQKEIHTPEIDRLAAEGVRFTQFYAGATVCAPSRSVLMTGRHTGHTTVRGNAGKNNPEAQTLRPEDVTLAEIFKAARYRTALVGKWGLGDGPDSPGHPQSQGFDEFFGYLNQSHAHNQFPSWLWRGREKVTLQNDLAGDPDGTGAGYATQPKEYIGDLMEREALDFIGRAKAEPFFLFYAAVVPHANNERTRVLKDGQEVPDYGRYADKPWPDANKGLAASITRLDDTLGKIRARLAELNLTEHTLIIFSSDNGPHREGGHDAELFNPNGPLRGFKRALSEGGIRVPFIAAWPGTIRPNVSAHAGSFADLHATCLELTGAAASAPENADSLSLLPVLTGSGPPAQHPVLYWEFHENGFSQAVLMEGRWKGIRERRRDEPVRLYDLQTDPGEERDLADDQPERVARVRSLFTGERSESPLWPVKDAPDRTGNGKRR